MVAENRHKLKSNNSQSLDDIRPERFSSGSRNQKPMTVVPFIENTFNCGFKFSGCDIFCGIGFDDSEALEAFIQMRPADTEITGFAIDHQPDLGLLIGKVAYHRCREAY